MSEPPAVRVGVDLVLVSRIAESVERFGERFLRRVFSDDEIDYARSAPASMHQRLAARFAAKEAAIKALGLAGQAVNWHDLEVRRDPSGQCRLALHGRAGEWAAQIGAGELALSLSHEGDYATAVVVSMGRRIPTP